MNDTKLAISSIFGVLMVIVIILSLSTCNEYNKAKESSNLLYSLTDSLETFRNKDSQHVAKISILETSSVKDFLALQSKDSVIQKLQATVKHNKSKLGKDGSVTVISGTTQVDGATTTTVTDGTSVTKGDTVYLYPKYDFTINQFGKWVTGNGSSTKDSTRLNIKVDNDYTVLLGYEKRKVPGKLLPKTVPYVEVTNENPYTETKSMRSYKVSAPKQKNFGVMVGVGYGGYFDPSRLRVGHGIQGSVILGYQIIPIK
jgi:hypothetical protein